MWLPIWRNVVKRTLPVFAFAKQNLLPVFAHFGAHVVSSNAAPIGAARTRSLEIKSRKCAGIWNQKSQIRTKKRAQKCEKCKSKTAAEAEQKTKNYHQKNVSNTVGPTVLLAPRYEVTKFHEKVVIFATKKCCENPKNATQNWRALRDMKTAKNTPLV